jgi:hypothetical protein
MKKKKGRLKRMNNDLKIGYFALGFFLCVLSLTLILKPPIPIQAILVVIAIIIMLFSNTRLNDLLAGIILHPIMAMTVGFLVAGALALAGGFDALIEILKFIVELKIGNHPILGYIGVTVILVNLPTILPMPCGRILAAVLIPAIFLWGKALKSEILKSGKVNPLAEKIPMIILIAFIVNAAASCGPSPLGGIGGIGEGNLGLEIGSGSKAQQGGIMIATGLAALILATLYVGIEKIVLLMFGG